MLTALPQLSNNQQRNNIVLCWRSYRLVSQKASIITGENDAMTAQTIWTRGPQFSLLNCLEGGESMVLVQWKLHHRVDSFNMVYRVNQTERGRFHFAESGILRFLFRTLEPFLRNHCDSMSKSFKRKIILMRKKNTRVTLFILSHTLNSFPGWREGGLSFGIKVSQKYAPSALVNVWQTLN